MSRFKKDFDWEQIERDNAPEEEIIYVSKSEIKRDGKEYRKIAQLIVDLPMNKIEGFKFDEVLLNAIKDCKTLTTMEGKRRQINFVSKHLRRYELDVLQAAIINANPTQYSGLDAQLDKRIRVTIERLRQAQFTEKTLDLLAKQFPEFDREKVKTLLAESEETTNPQLTQGSELYSYFFDLYRPKAN